MAIDRRAAADLLNESRIDTGLLELTDATQAVLVNFPEVQNALWAASNSAESALQLASVTNRLIKRSEDKSLQGPWVDPAVDLLRAALLFASAGVDTSLKKLVKHAVPQLLRADDANVEEQFRKWAEARISRGPDGGIDPKELVTVLLTKGDSPRDSLAARWCYDLTSASAQSVERVEALAQALGVTDNTLRKRTSSSSKESALRTAFVARNEIAHELDVTDPSAETRVRLERIRQYRTRTDITAWCAELLEVTQLIVNDVADRLPPT